MIGRETAGSNLPTTDSWQDGFALSHRFWKLGKSRLYECISEMKKGSASDYDAETGEGSAGREARIKGAVL